MDCTISSRTLYQAFGPEAVSVTDPVLGAAFRREVDYLLTLSPRRLLSDFYVTNGLPAPAPRYGGWESMEIKGHTLGHYLCALSQAYAASPDRAIYSRWKETLDGLEASQRPDGYLGAFPDEHFDRVEQKKPVWVPWYTMHKILSGLVSAATLPEGEQALGIAARLGDWIAARTASWSEETRLRVLAVEYGGMNDCLYELYKLTGNEKHLQAAHAFTEDALFARIEAGEDVLKGLHANTTIPKFLGALNRYVVTGEEFYLRACTAFFDMVADNHSYITGGNSEWEHFGQPGLLDARRTNCTCETCNSYNMLKLAAGLFGITGQRKYADFYERTVLNAILPSQNPASGMTMYFQPMAAGYFKVYGQPYDSFWCCTGSGMESFTKLGTQMYHQSQNAITVNRYVSSILTADPLRLTVDANLPESDTVTIRISISISGVKPPALRLRIPDWTAAAPSLAFNGKPVSIDPDAEYIELTQDWQDGDTLRLTLPMEIQAHRLPDNPNTAAFRYGPAVLCAALGMEDMTTAKTGVDVTIPAKPAPVKDFIVVKEGGIDGWFDRLNRNIVKGEGLVFTLRNTDSDDVLRFTPYYAQHQQRYGIYFHFVAPDSMEFRRHLLETAERERLEAATVDRIPMGNDQYELEHHIQGANTEAQVRDGLRCRTILQNGWFALRIKLVPGVNNLLSLSFHSAKRGGSVSIYADDVLLAREAVRTTEPFALYTQSFAIPADICAKGEAALRFAAENGQDFNGLYDEIRVYSGI